MRPPLITPVGFVLALALGQLFALVFGSGVLAGLFFGLFWALARVAEELWERRRRGRGATPPG